MKSSKLRCFSYRWLTKETIQMPMDKTRIILLYLSVNYLIIFIDVLIAHALNRFFPIYEWIPIVYSPVAALVALLLFLKPKLGIIKSFHYIVNMSGVVIGILGFAFHLQAASAGNAVSFSGLTGGNPVFAPLAFVALGSLGVISVIDDKPNLRTYNMTNKTRWLLLVTSFWFLATALVAYFDHARLGFHNYFTWIPVYAGIFVAVILFLQAYSSPEQGLSVLLGISIILSVLVGLLGFAFHLSADLAGRGSIQWSRIFYQAPGLVPLLFCDLGIWGGLVFLDPIKED